MYRLGPYQIAKQQGLDAREIGAPAMYRPRYVQNSHKIRQPWRIPVVESRCPDFRE